MFRHFTAAAAIVLVAGCADLTKYKTEGASLLASYGPKVAELLKQHSGLAELVGKLPADFAGVQDVLTQVKAHGESLGALKGLVDGFSGRLDEAVKGGKEDGVKALLASFKADVEGKLAQEGAALKALTGQAQALETAVQQAAQARAAFEKQLSTGFSLKGNVTGIEAQLVSFIEDAAKPVDKTTWFNFDRLNFKTGSAEVDMDTSKDQLVNMAEILKAYPKVTLKIGGYTDNQGKADANKKLSAARAEAVAKALVDLGAAKARVDPEGYGAEHPVCAANDTDECRAQNRRIAVRVKEK